MKVKRLKNRSPAIESFRTGTKWILESDHLGGSSRWWSEREAGRGYRTGEETKREVEKGKG